MKGIVKALQRMLFNRDKGGLRLTLQASLCSGRWPTGGTALQLSCFSSLLAQLVRLPCCQEQPVLHCKPLEPSAECVEQS